MTTYLNDTVQAHELQADGSYIQPAAAGDNRLNAQQWLLERRDYEW